MLVMPPKKLIIKNVGKKLRKIAMSFKTTDGYLVMVEGNSRYGKEWFLALPWQAKRFVEVMRFGEMKSMGIPNPRDEQNHFKRMGINTNLLS